MLLIASKRCEAPDCRSQRTQDSKLGAIVAIVCVEGVADETAVARPASKPADLPLKLNRRCRQQRNSKCDAGIADREASRKIVAAVDHEVVAADQLLGIIRDPIRCSTGLTSTKRFSR